MSDEITCICWTCQADHSDPREAEVSPKDKEIAELKEKFYRAEHDRDDASAYALAVKKENKKLRERIEELVSGRDCRIKRLMEQVERMRDGLRSILEIQSVHGAIGRIVIKALSGTGEGK